MWVNAIYDDKSGSILTVTVFENNAVVTGLVISEHKAVVAGFGGVSQVGYSHMDQINITRNHESQQNIWFVGIWDNKHNRPTRSGISSTVATKLGLAPKNHTRPSSESVPEITIKTSASF